MDGVHHAAGAAVEAVLGAIVSDVSQHASHDVLHVYVRLGADFSSDHDKTGGDQRLACAAKLRGVGRLTRGGDVALLRPTIDFFRENGVEDGVGNLVANLVGMAFGHGLGREDVI